MKPLLSEPLTDEDRAAWFDWQVNRRRDWLLWGRLERLSFPADRHDAELMLTAQRMRGFGFTDRIAVPSLMELGWHASGGELS